MDSRYFIYLLIILSGAVYGLVRYRHLSSVYRMLCLYLVLIYLSESATRVLPYFIGSSAPVYHLLVPIQIAFYTAFFYQTLNLSGTGNKLLIAGGGLTAFISLVNSLFLQSFLDMPSNSIMLLSLLVVSLTLVQFKNMLLRMDTIPLARNPLFWFSIGGIVFYCVTFFAFTLFYIQGDVPQWVYDLIWFCNVVMYSCYAYTLHLAYKKETT